MAQRQWWQGRQAIEGAYGFVLAVIVAKAQTWFSLTGWLGFVCWVSILLGLFWLLRVLPKPKAIAGVVENTIRLDREVEDYQFEHFVGFVPLYRDPRPEKEQLSEEERMAVIARLDFGALALEQSNFAPTIEALRLHRQHLQHIWLMDTVGTEGGGSQVYTKLFVHFLREQFEDLKGCKFHCGEAFSIPMQDDDLVLTKTYAVVDRIISEIRGPWYRWGRPRVLVDFTTGVRTMLLGMVFAAMSRGIKAEFVGTEYGGDGNIVPGSLVPMVLDFSDFGRSLD